MAAPMPPNYGLKKYTPKDTLTGEPPYACDIASCCSYYRTADADAKLGELTAKLTEANAERQSLDGRLRDQSNVLTIIRNQRDIARKQLSEARFDLIDSERKQLRFYGVPVVVSTLVPDGVLYHALDRDVYYVTGKMYAELQNSLDKINSRDTTIRDLRNERNNTARVLGATGSETTHAAAIRVMETMADLRDSNRQLLGAANNNPFDAGINQMMYATREGRTYKYDPKTKTVQVPADELTQLSTKANQWRVNDLGGLLDKNKWQADTLVEQTNRNTLLQNSVARQTVEIAALRAQVASIYEAAEKWQFSPIPTPFTAHSMLVDAATTIAKLKRLATLQPTTGASSGTIAGRFSGSSR